MSQPSPNTLLFLSMDHSPPFPSAMSSATNLKSQRTLSDGGPSLTKIPYSSPNFRQAYKTLPPLFHSPDHHRGLSHLFLPSDTVSSQNHPHHVEDAVATCMTRINFNTEARMYSSRFPANHQLNLEFVQTYHLEDELGSGGYGFVLTAFHRTDGHEVAVKFIIKDKVPEHAWMEDELIGRLPAEVVLLSYVNHENVVKCLDIFEDALYYYLVQELHGSPWNKHHKLDVQPPCQYRPSSSMSTPALSPSASESSLPASEPGTPPHIFATIQPRISLESGANSSGSNCKSDDDIPKLLHVQLSLSQDGNRPDNYRRPSHDLFECIEQSENKRLTEAQARYVFAQVVDAVEYLDRHGIAHRDIKDENLVIDKNLKVKLIDFGSATSVNPGEPRPFYKQFYGTAAYASSEILLKKSYQAAPAEIWTLGVLLSYLVAGVSPFPTARDAADGRIFLSEKVVGKISDDAMDLMRRCLDCNPTTRATIAQVKAHGWLTGSTSHL